MINKEIIKSTESISPDEFVDGNEWLLRIEEKLRARVDVDNTLYSESEQQEIDRLDWRHRAACKDFDDPDIFYVDSKEIVRSAKQICMGCVVVEQCLRSAYKKDEYGVWGGTTRKERLSRPAGFWLKQLSN